MVNDAMQSVSSDQRRKPSRELTVLPVKGESPKRARATAAYLNLAYRDDGGSSGPNLVVGETATWLELEGAKVTAQFDSSAMRHRRRGGHNELLGRAIGVKENYFPTVFDATGGLARDAFVLADLGCRVTVCERVTVLAWLVQDALEAAQVSAHDHVREAVGRMRVIAADSAQLTVEERSVLYLDPMFPERKKAAAVRKEAAALQYLAEALEDEIDLWEWAWRQPVERIVVKRPLRAPTLGPQNPSHTLSGKAIRFDVFVRQRGNGGPSDRD